MKSAETITKEQLAFDEELYERWLKGFQLAEKYLGLKIFVHARDEVLQDGQIFLFNHFARFETMIPVYIFYERFRTFTRTIADHELFEMNDRLRDFLCGAGAVPNNLPGLLPFLAAELLRGHRVVIFPEGAMIKTRQVMDDRQQFNVFSHSTQTRRKHHSGAAVLALTLDLFKRRIQMLFDQNDTRRLDHWCKALEFENHEALRAKIEKPTLIVPGTITFSPIRIGGNFFSNALKLLNHDISEQLLEEAVIEGNILLKNTDMDIRFGEPIDVHKEWTWWENWLINNYFKSIRSLDDFFSLRDRMETRSERLLSSILNRETARIRDEYVKGLYKGITINTAHVASLLVYAYLEQGQKLIKQQEFHHALYFAVKALQNDPDINLIHHLSKPDNYRFLYRGESPRLSQFIHTATRAGLIETTSDSYVLLDKLEEEHGFHEVRLENPISVSAHEAEPVPAMKEIVARAIEMAREIDPGHFASLLWDDELRAFAWEKEKFSREEYLEINRFETATKEREPFLLTHKDSNKPGVLLIHGFLSSPAELVRYGQHIHARGYNVLGVRLAGHGTSPCDLHERRWEEWFESVRRGYEILAAISSEVIVAGFSAGGTLALLLAEEKPDKLKAVLSVCAPLKAVDRKIHFARLINLIDKLVGFIPKIGFKLGYVRSDTVYGDTNYRMIPVHSLVELKGLMNAAAGKLRRIETPLLIVQSREDKIVNQESASIIHDNVASTDKRLVWIETDNHHILRENVLGSWDLFDAFIDAKAGTGSDTES